MLLLRARSRLLAGHLASISRPAVSSLDLLGRYGRINRTHYFYLLLHFYLLRIFS